MGRTIGLALVLVFFCQAQSGELGLQLGYGKSADHGNELIFDYRSYFLGASVRHWEIVSGLLWPEAFAGIWYSEPNRYYDEFLFAPSSYVYYSNYLGTQEGVQLMFGDGRGGEAQPHFVLPLVGIGIAAHQAWGLYEYGDSPLRADYSRMQSRTTAKLLARLVFPLPVNREIFFEGEMHPDPFDHKPLASNRTQYLFSMGYRFSAF